jgi:hypothetical protein
MTASLRLDAGGGYATGLAKIESHVSLKARQRDRTLLPAARHGREVISPQTNIFLEMVHRRRVGDIGDFGGVDVFIESFCLLSGALDPPGFVVSMRADFDEFFPFHYNFGGGFLFQLAAARGIGR